MRREVYEEMAAIQETHWWFSGRRRVLAAVIKRMQLPASADLLEVGCGPGGNLPMLSRFGTLKAMESDPFALELARALGCGEVCAGSLPDAMPFCDSTFDLICLFDVLEHIEDDVAALKQLAFRLKPGGKLLLTVPAYRWLWSSHDDAHHHHRRYDARTLGQCAATAGLRVARIGYFNTLLFPLIASIRAARRIARSDAKAQRSDAQLASPNVNRVLETIFAFERFIVPLVFLPFGTSVIAVLEA